MIPKKLKMNKNDSRSFRNFEKRFRARAREANPEKPQKPTKLGARALKSSTGSHFQPVLNSECSENGQNVKTFLLQQN